MTFIKYERPRPPMTSKAPLFDNAKCCQSTHGDEAAFWPWNCTREPGHKGMHEAGMLDGTKVAEWS